MAEYRANPARCQLNLTHGRVLDCLTITYSFNRTRQCYAGTFCLPLLHSVHWLSRHDPVFAPHHPAAFQTLIDTARARSEQTQEVGRSRTATGYVKHSRTEENNPVSDNKSEAAGAPEFQPKSSRAASADGESKSEIAAAKQSSPAPVKESPPASASSIQPNGAQVGKEKAAGRDEPDQSLGAFLIAAREGRGLTADDVARETRLPRHYLRMMETNDYSEISDQLYLVPFLRRYASFLDLDQEDVAMRFVREVQRADGNPGPARLDQPLVAEPRRHRGWTGAIVVIGLLVAAASLYIYESDRHRQVSADTLMPHSSAGVVGTGSDTSNALVPPQPAR
jgi:hypothetical protein